MLDRASTRIILICAPAGYGKSTLIHQWLNSRRHTWCSTSEASADVAVIGDALAKSLCEINPDAARLLRNHLAVAVESSDPVAHLAAATVQAFASWPDDALLVIDDFHFIPSSSACERVVDALITRTRVRLLIASRVRPRWSSARMRVYGGVTELTQSDLAMSRAEARRLFTRRPAAEVGSIISACDGWPAALSLAWSTNSRAFSPRAAALPRDLYDFIADEVFCLLSPETQHFLPTLALAGRLDNSILERVLGRRGLARMRADLERTGFMTSEQDPFQLHPLFQTFLRQRYGHEDLTLRRSLVDALLREMRWDDAFRVAATPPETRLVGDVLTAALRPMLDLGRIATLSKWREQISSATTAAEVRVLTAELARRRGHYAEASAHALQAVHELPATHPLVSFALSIAGSAAHLSHADTDALAYYVKAEGASQNHRDTEESIWGSLLASAALEERSVLSRVEARLEEVLDSADPAAQLRRATARYVIGRVRGSFASALPTADGVRPLAFESRDPRITSVFLHSLAYMQAFDARYAESLRTANDALTHVAEFRLHFARTHIRATEALARIGLGDFATAELIIRDLLGSSHNIGAHRFIEINCNLMLARVALASGDTKSAIQLTKLHGVDPPEKAIFSELIGMNALALAIAGDRDKCNISLIHARSISSCVESSCLCLAAEAILDIDAETGRGTNVIPKALTIATLCGRDALITATRAHDSLRLALEAHVSNDKRLLGLLRWSPSVNPIPDVWGADTRDSTLTHRETEVAELLVLGRSNKQIAEQLVIAESTAKLHVRMVLKKLEVKTRTEAVVKLLKHGYG